MYFDEKQSLSLTEARKRKGLTGAEVCSSLGITEAALSYYESGLREPSAVIFMKMCNLYDVEPEQICLDAYLSLSLTEARIRKGLSRAETCRRLGISETALSNYERGLREPGAILFMRMCRLYGVAPEQIRFDPRLVASKVKDFSEGRSHEREDNG